jgi:hypothetical protein
VDNSFTLSQSSHFGNLAWKQPNLAEPLHTQGKMSTEAFLRPHNGPLLLKYPPQLWKLLVFTGNPADFSLNMHPNASLLV